VRNMDGGRVGEGKSRLEDGRSDSPCIHTYLCMYICGVNMPMLEMRTVHGVVLRR
jgi:hypothetical protein